MTNTSRPALRMSAAAALAVTALSAHAEYRCATPGLLWLGERKACELAQQPTPDALVHFIHRTVGVYNLYIYDYVNDSDGARWEQAKRQTVPSSAAVAEAKRDTGKASKLD
jgi:hypothetical protein